MPRKKSGLGKKIAVNIALVLFGLLVIFALSEAALRVSMPRFLEQSLSYYEIDPDVGYKYQANLDVNVAPAQGEKLYRLQTNSLGYREKEIMPKGEGVVRIMGLGDSFTFGVDVEKQETFLSVLEEEMNANSSGKKFETLNFGVSAYGTLHEKEVLKKFGKEITPDIVLVNFYLGNDFYDNATKSIGSFSESNGNDCGNAFSCAYGFLKQNSYLVAFIELQVGKIPAVKKVFFDLGLARHFLPNEIMMLKENAMPEEQIAIEKTKEYLAGIKTEAESLGAEPVLVIIPSGAQVDSETLNKFAEAYYARPEDFDIDRPNRILRQIAEEAGIETIDLAPALREKNSYAKMFLPGVGHFTVEGNKAAAETIAGFLEERVDKGA